MGSRGGSIEAPHTIASLPGPLDREHGQIQAAPVIGIKASNKRKRHEVAVGVGGEGVNIYNIQNHSLITSYALPPQSYLCCSPCSIHHRPSSSSIVSRRTFVAIKEGRNSSKRRLLSFAENVRTKRNSGQETSGPEKRECKLHDGEILSLEPISSISNERQSVLVNYRNGGAEFISEDLSKRHWQDAARLDNDEIYVVEHATVLEIGNAKRGLLKSREDIVASLEQDGPSASNGTLLCRLIRSKQGRRFELYTLRDPNQDALQTSRNPLQFVTSYELPSTQQASTSSAHYELHAETGLLYQLLDNVLRIYDLSSTIPKLAIELGGQSHPINSFTRVSSNLVLTFSNGTATLFETSFGSIRGSVVFKPVDSGAKAKKRKREDPNEAAPLHAVSTFTDLGLVTAFANDQLIAFQLQDSLTERRRLGSRATLLSSVVGNGSVRVAREHETSEAKEKQWAIWKTQVDALIADEDLEDLERLVANDASLGRQRKHKTSRKQDEREKLRDGHAEVYEELWPLPEAFDPRYVDRRKALYILGLVFSYGESEIDSLQIRLESTKLLEWLALTGLLTVSEVHRAHQADPRNTGTRNQPLEQGAIMTAVRQIDGDFQVIRDLLSLPVHWEAAEVIQALRQVIQSFDAPPTEGQMLALPAPPTTNGEIEMTNGDIDLDLEHESEAVEKELDLAMSTLSTGLEVRSDLVQVITRRLHAFPPNTVTTAMREMMSHSEIVFFIHILRIELADGGWTSQYVDLGDSEIQDGLVNTIGVEEERGQPSDQAIKAIGDLLNCAVDAIGTSGWLVGQSGSVNGADGLIDTLRAEISAGLEGCYEATTLQTLLTELEKCYAISEKSAARPRDRAITEEDPMDLERSFLPLSSKVGSQLAHGRNQKADHKKSKMAVGREKSRQVGKYSFERIRI